MAKNKKKPEPLPVPTPQDAEPSIDPVASQMLIERRRIVGLRKEMSEKDAKAWADSLALRLLPDVMAEIAFDVRYGSKKERDAAGEKVLRMNGMDRREATQATAPTIILNLGSGDKSTPWLDIKAKKPGKPSKDSEEE